MKPSILTTLRDMVPIRPLTRLEAMGLAERQAQRFLKLAGISEPPVPETIIAGLPRIHVSRLRPFPHSGASQWSSGRWLVILNGAESPARQRFSLAHEFKHILDDRFVNVMYQGIAESQRQDWIEQVCHYFAGCLLAPRPWVKRAYGARIQRPGDLAAHFDVSPSAMQVRLNQIGLVEPTPRCDRTAPRLSLPDTAGAGTPATYFRLATAPVP